MSLLSSVPHRMVERKPAHGRPCNRCGLCCWATLCVLGQHLFGHERGPCPALQDLGDETFCDVASNPTRYAPERTHAVGEMHMRDAALLLIGADGLGCDARINGERRDWDFHRKCEQAKLDNKTRIGRARRLWGMEHP